MIQFQTETDADAGRFEGRVEHVASSRAIHFQSLDELVKFLGCVLTKVRAEAPEQETGGPG